MNRPALGLTILLFSAGAAWAQEAPPQTPPPAPAKPADPESLKLARAVLDETNTSANTMLIIDAMTPNILQNMKQAKPDIPEAVLKEFGTLFRQEMVADLPQLLDAEAQVYAQHFTIAELHGLADFYGSDLGKKAIAETPTILRETIPLGAAWGRAAGEDAMKRVIEKLRAEGVKI